MPFRRGKLDDKRFVPAARAQRHDGIGRDRLRRIGADGGCKRSGSARVARTSSPETALQSSPLVRATPPEAIAAAGCRHAEGFVVPLREQRGVLDRRTQAPTLAFELCARIAVESRVDERRREADHDQHHQDFRQGETGEPTGREQAPDTQSRAASNALRLEVPRADVGIDAGAARRSVGAEAEHVDFAAQPGV